MAVMTDNEAQLFTGQSPTDTAAQLLWYTGRPWAVKLVVFQIRSECARANPVPLAIAFWAAVLMRLNIYPAERAIPPNPRQLAAFKSVEARAFQAGVPK